MKIISRSYISTKVVNSNRWEKITRILSVAFPCDNMKKMCFRALKRKAQQSKAVRLFEKLIFCPSKEIKIKRSMFLWKYFALVGGIKISDEEHLNRVKSIENQLKAKKTQIQEVYRKKIVIDALLVKNKRIQSKAFGRMLLKIAVGIERSKKRRVFDKWHHSTFLLYPNEVNSTTSILNAYAKYSAYVKS